MTKTMGYGNDYSFWDAKVKERFKDQLEKLGKVRYENFCVFKSPKGRWMAFHNTSYTDIKVYDLETLELVATDFYSKSVRNEDGSYNRELSTYASHTNASTFVPVYMPRNHGKYTSLDDMSGLVEEDWLSFCDWDRMISPPIAFNSWTIWAADFEFYVDVLDLREIDNGIIKKWPDVCSFEIPRSGYNVRDFVEIDADLIINRDKEINTTIPAQGDFVIDFNILQERKRDRFAFNTATGEIQFGDMHKEGFYEPKDTLPWEETRKRIDEYHAAKARTPDHAKL
jgi:hypothetical protein